MAQSLLTNEGFSFPFTLYGRTGVSSGIDYIRQGIRSALAIDFFDLLMKPSGSRVMECLFEPLDTVLLDVVKVYVLDALSSYTQISVRAVDIVPVDNEDSHRVRITVSYLIAQSSLADSVSFVVSASGA